MPAGDRLSGNGPANVNTAGAPALTIITPARNAAAFIEGCLRNVIEQDCPAAEHIIIDGQSQDGTAAILESFSRRYPHIHYISEPDQGQSDALNKGLRMARAAVLGILNVDDHYEPGVLPAIVRRFATLPVPSLLVGDCNMWDTHGRKFAVNRPRYLDLEHLLLGPERAEFPFNPSSYFYHRRIHEIAGEYDVQDHYTMDLDFLLRAVTVAHAAHVDEVWGNFRLRQGSKTHQEMAAGRNLANVEAVLIRHIARLPVGARWRVRLRRAALLGLHRNSLRARHLVRKALKAFGR